MRRRKVVREFKQIYRGLKFVIPPTDGKAIFTTAFLEFAEIDTKFERLGCDVPSRPTLATAVQIFTSNLEATPQEVLRRFKVNLNKLCLTQHQAICFIRAYGPLLRTRRSGGVYFLFKANRKFFVVLIGHERKYKRFWSMVAPLKNNLFGKGVDAHRWFVVPKRR